MLKNTIYIFYINNTILLDFLKHANDCLCIKSLPQMFGVLWSFKNRKPGVLPYLCIFLLILFSYSYEESRFGRLQY